LVNSFYSSAYNKSASSLEGAIDISCNILSATQIAIIAAVVLVIADVIALVAAVKAFEEEQKNKADSNRDIENEIIFLKGKLR
jgi:ACR3 family arsenite efflux pump ArsB